MSWPTLVLILPNMETMMKFLSPSRSGGELSSVLLVLGFTIETHVYLPPPALQSTPGTVLWMHRGAPSSLSASHRLYVFSESKNAEP